MEIKIKKNNNFGFIKIRPTYNNVFMTLTDIEGNVIITKRTGLLNFKGSKNRTPYVASQVFKQLLLTIKKLGIKFKAFIIQFQYFIRKKIVKLLIKQLKIVQFENVIYLEYINKKVHNGLRLKKKRRL